VSESLPQQLFKPLRYAAAWMGGWSRLIALILVIVAALIGIRWQQSFQPPIPEQASLVQSAINGDLRQTTFLFAGSVEELRLFYRERMPERGWRYCGTQADPGCSHVPSLIGRDPTEFEIYRRTNDLSNSGRTIEIWSRINQQGQVFVTIYETRPS
jgi:hypothetical protein